MTAARPIEVVTYDEAAQLLRISRSSLQRLIRAEQLRVITISSGIRRIDRSSIERYLASR